MTTAAEKYSLSIEAIKDSIASVVSTAAPKAKIIKRFIVAEDDQWAAMIKSPLDLNDDGEQVIHAVQISHDGTDQVDDAPNQSVNPLISFLIVFYMAYDIGTDTDNSEKRLQKEIAEVMWALAVSTDLGMNETNDPNIAGCVMGHRGLRVPRMAIRKFGSEVAQLGIGGLQVRMQSRFIRA